MNLATQIARSNVDRWTIPWNVSDDGRVHLAGVELAHTYGDMTSLDMRPFESLYGGATLDTGTISNEGTTISQATFRRYDTSFLDSVATISRASSLTDNEQALIDALRARVDTLEERNRSLTARVDLLEARNNTLDARIQEISNTWNTRFEMLEGRLHGTR